MKIVVDAMGGDNAPHVVVEGVVEAVREFDVNVVLFGDETIVGDELKKHSYPENRIEVMHAPEAVGMHEPATISIRKKKNSSITLGIKSLKEFGFDAFISAGNTGAVVAASTIHLGMLEGVERPAIGTVIPTLTTPSFLMDVGANTEAKPKHLLHSALLAGVYSQTVLGIDNPTIGLLNIGEEASKGSGFEKETYKLLEDHIPNFIGNVEANEVFKGKSDCIICDGFVGNVVLKTAEGLMESASKIIKREIKKNPLAILAALLLKLTMTDVRKLVDYSEYGGAPLMGVNGLVMICHGRSNTKAIKNAIRATSREIENNMIDSMRKVVSANAQ